MGVCESCEYRDNPIGHCCNKEGELLYIKFKEGRKIRYEVRCERIREEIKFLIDKGVAIKIHSRWYEDIGWPLGKTETLPVDPQDKTLTDVISPKPDKTPQDIEAEYKRVESTFKKAGLTPKEEEVFRITEYELAQKKVDLARKWEVSRPAVTKNGNSGRRKIQKIVEKWQKTG